MMRSMFSGVSGLRVHQTKMDVIANNISNVNTTGYKSSRVTFTEVFNQKLSGASGANEETQRGGVNPTQIGLGAGVASIDKLMTTGAAQRTDNPFDLMIQGEGFFIVGDVSGQYFTRAGALQIDEAGNLVTVTGLKVMGWDSDAKGLSIDQGVVKPLEITGNKQYIVPKPTTKVDFSGNLNAAENLKSTDGKITTMTFYDSVGNYYVVDTRLKYNAETQEWNYSIGDLAYLNGDRTSAIKVEAGSSNTGTIGLKFGDRLEVTPTTTNWLEVGEPLKFDTNGILTDPIPQDADTSTLKLGQIAITIDNPTADSGVVPGSTFGSKEAADDEFGTLILDFSGLTQFGNETSNATSQPIDGNKPGKLNGVSIGTDGVMIGRYSNGQTKMLGQIPIAIFSNPAGLEKVGNNLFVTTPNSGDFDGVGVAVQSTGGSMLGGVLEMSNVDLSSEFTEMITTQRGFQANSRVITTSDDMLQELVNLKR